MSDEQKKPRATVAAYIVNAKGDILLIRSPKWMDKLVPPGGHIEYGERAEDAMIREVKEETGLMVKLPTLLTYINMIEPKDFTPYQAHFVGLQIRAELDGEDQAVRMQKSEASAYEWLAPEEIVGRKDVEDFTREIVKKYFVEKNTSCPKCEISAKQSGEYKQGWQRALSDYQNLQKDVSRQRGEWASMSEAQILEEFLPIYSNFKKAFAATHADDSWTKGIGFIMKQMGDLLKNHGIEEIKTVGEMFDASKHETVGEEESDEKEHMIIREIDGGYMMRGKVLKVAKVIVAK